VHTEAAGWIQSCPIHAELRRTIDDLSTYVANLFQTMADKWAPGTTGPRFHRASYIQVNYYEPAQHSRDMLQDGHEDGHLITLVTANSPGLEIQIGDKYEPVEIGADEMLIMPGSLLTLMTGSGNPAAVPSGEEQPARRLALFDDVLREPGGQPGARALDPERDQCRPRRDRRSQTPSR